MKIFVCLKEVIDPTLSLDFGLRHKAVFQEGLPLRLNPNDATALGLALSLKSRAANAEITLVSIGPSRVESYLRNGLALGADRSMRLWSEDFIGISPYQKAKILSRAASFYGADMIFTGSRSLDTANGQVGPLMAAWLNLPCISDVVGLELDQARGNILATKDIGRGEREKVECPLPAVVTVKGEGKLPYASLDSLIESQQREIIPLSPTDLGISTAELENNPTRVTGLDYPRPRPSKVPPLDTSLPAFYRILQLLQGGISRRRGLVLQGNAEELADQLFQLLKEEGVIKSARGI